LLWKEPLETGIKKVVKNVNWHVFENVLFNFAEKGCSNCAGTGWLGWLAILDNNIVLS
jgi:hypothetical protein